MGSIGQAIGGAVGAAAGAYFGGAQGAYLGFSVGMLVGSFVDPPRQAQKVSEYKMQDVHYNEVTHNLPVPIVYGVNRVAGNILWLGNAHADVETGGKTGASGGGEKKGGKKSGDQQIVQAYADWVVALSEGPIVGVSDVFVGERRMSEMEGLDYTIYLGTGSQTADPRLVTDLGSMAPNFRNTAYLAIGGGLGPSPNFPTINAEVSGREGGARRIIGGWALGANAVCQRGFVQGDGSWLAMTHVGAQIFRSVTYGEQWSLVASAYDSPEGAGVWNGLAQHPGVWGRAYATYRPYNAGDVYIIRSDDFGQTWPYVSALVCNPSNPFNAYGYPYTQAFDGNCILGIRENSSTVLFFSVSFSVQRAAWCYKSTDAGANFLPTYEFTTAGLRGGVVAALEVPNGAVFAHLGGVGGTLHGLWRSTDQGGTFTWLTSTGGPVQDAAIAFNEKYAMFGCADGSVMVTFTGGEGYWEMATTGPVWNIGWMRRETGLETMNALTCNSLGIFLASGQLDDSYRVAYSLDAGYTWHLHRHAGLEMNDWGAVGSVIFWTDLYLCFGVGYGSPFEGVPFVGAAVTCEQPLIPTSCGNPALVIHDLVTDQRYGQGLPDDRVSWSSITSCSLYCLEQVPTGLTSTTGNPAPLTEQRFCLDYVVDTARPVVDHLRDMLASFRAYLCYSQGTVKLKIERPEIVTQSFGMAEIIANTFTWKKQGYRERPNVVRVEYIEPGRTVIDATGQTVSSDLGRYISTIEGQTAFLYTGGGYKPYAQDFVEASDPWDIAQTNERRERVLTLVGIKRRTQATRMAYFYLNKAIHCQHACTFRVGIGALRAEVGDVIAVSHDVPRWAGKQFRIVEIEEAESDELTLGCLEYSDAIFNDAMAVVPHGQDLIVGHVPSPTDLFAAPHHVGRLSAYERPGDGTIEVTYTRVVTGDLFGGVNIYKRIGETGAWELIGRQLSTAPTAYLASHLGTVTLIQSG